MRRKFSIAIVLLIVTMMVAGAVAPAFAATEYDVSVRNKNPYTITLTFVGLKVYQFELPPGRTTIQMERGVYRHSYYGCGQLNFGDFTVNPKNNELTIADCNAYVPLPEPKADEGLFSITNKSNKNLEVSLVGQYNFVLDADIGKTQHIVKRGTYQLSYYDCGKLNIETIQITKETDYKINNCQTPKEITIDPRAKVLNISNKTFTSFPIYMFGLDNNTDYEFTLSNGTNQLYVLPGTYRYSYYACSGLHIGNITVTLRGANMKISNCNTTGNGDAQTPNIVPFRVKNNTAGTLYVYLEGQFKYLFSVLSPDATLYAEKGYYKYTLYGCGRTFTGEVVIDGSIPLIKTPICRSSSQ